MLLKKNKSKTLGYIKIVETPTFISKYNKYWVEVRAYKSIEKREYDTFFIFSDIVDIQKVRRKKRLRGVIGKVLEKFDKEEGNTFYHYTFYISCNGKYDPEDVAHYLKEYLERDEKCEIQSVYAEQIKLFPWEKTKVKSRIPITQEMVDGMIKAIDDMVERKKRNDKTNKE